MKATLVFELSEAGRRDAAKRGLPKERCAAIQKIPGVDVPAEFESNVYVDHTGEAWITTIRTTNSKAVGAPDRLGLYAVEGRAKVQPRPYGYSRSGEPYIDDAYHALDSAIADAAEGSALLASLVPVQAENAALRAQLKAADEAKREERTKKEQQAAIERNAALDAALMLWERDHALARKAGLPKGGTLSWPDVGRIDGDGYGWPEYLRLRLAELRTAIQAEDDSAKAEVDRQQKAKLRDILGSGPRHVLERFDYGVLPKQELRAALSAALFASLDRVPLYEEITDAEVVAALGCAAEDVSFSTEDEDELTSQEWETLQAVRKAAPAGAVVTPRIHLGYEDGRTKHSDPDVRRKSIRVILEFAGERLTRELAIP